MACSPARLAANRANAARSTGPKTEAGKARSRANALTHGLTAEVLRTPDEPARPAEGEARSMAEWLDDESALLRMRIDRARRIEDRERELAAIRAAACWDEDRAREADRIGAGLARRPGRVVRVLRGTPQGCTWLIDGWRRLLASAGNEGGWTADQQALASDLRGIAEELRARPVDPGDQAALASDQIRQLETLRESLTTCDAFRRETVEMGLDDGATPALRRAIRYESALFRRLRWVIAQGEAEPTPKPAPSPPPPRAHEPRPSPTRPLPPPAFDLAPPFDPETTESLMEEFAALSCQVLPIMMAPPGLQSQPR
jgi:hypothetical protein